MDLRGNSRPMWIFDHQTLQFLEVNRAAVSSYGYSRSEFLRMRITDIRPKDQIPKLLAGLRPFRLAGTHVTERQHLTKAQELIDVRITASQFYFKGRPAVLVEAQDITEPTKEQRALFQACSEMTAQLETAKAFLWKDPGRAAEYINGALCIAKRNMNATQSSKSNKSCIEIATRISNSLTVREQEVLNHLTAGKSNKEIAAHLKVSEGTIKLHVNHILRKLGTTARTEAAILAVKLGIVRI